MVAMQLLGRSNQPRMYNAFGFESEAFHVGNRDYFFVYYGYKMATDVTPTKSVLNLK